MNIKNRQVNAEVKTREMKDVLNGEYSSLKLNRWNPKDLFVITLGVLFFVFFNLPDSIGNEDQLKNLKFLKFSTRIKVTNRIWPRQYGQGVICLWKNDKLAATSITIDDNTKPDHEFWINLGHKYGWHWTWFIIVNRISKNFAYSGNWEDYRKLIEQGHDVQSHSFSHRNLDIPIEKDFADAIPVINKHLKNNKCLTFAYPSGAKSNEFKIVSKYYIAARGTTGGVNARENINYLNTYSMGRGLDFFLSKDIHDSFAGLLNPQSGKFRAWGNLLYHKVKNKKQVIKILDYLKKREKDVWIGTFTEVAQYGQESDTAKLTMKLVTPNSITFGLSDKMDDKLFNYPLTIKIKLNSTWKRIKSVQNDCEIKTEIIKNNGSQFVFVQAIPDRGDVILQKVK